MLKEVFLSREGMRSVLIIVVGIIVAVVADGIPQLASNIRDGISFAGIIVSVIGTQELCRLIVIVRNYHSEKEEQ